MIEPELLLQETSKIIQHYDHQAMLTGERFNLFSILGMETKENKTHSALLANLLNPRGSHLKGSVFLKLFLKEINHENAIDVKYASVTTEFYIGDVTIDEDNAYGGRIDIFIKDQNENSISIENKIYAGDQYKQILRYYNHNKGKNKVLYLTLQPKQPSADSKVHLEAEKDFFCISYKEHIIKWLKSCLLEVEDIPILKISIQQYISLLNKLTSIEMAENKELEALMLRYPDASKQIAENYGKCKEKLGEMIRQSVVTTLQSKLAGKYNVHPGDKTAYEYSQIWIKFVDYDYANLFFGIESFSYLLDHPLEVGVFNINGSIEINLPGKQKHRNKFWPYLRKFSDYEGIEVHFNNAELLQRIFLDDKYREGLVQHITEDTLKFIDDFEESLKSFLEEIYPKSIG